tara:strand:- start:56997 stop:57989 length:993 start_codon:yes stop_codon:yes gene_type:complete
LKKRKLFLIESESKVSYLLENKIGTKEDSYICIPAITGYIFKEVRDIKELQYSNYEYVNKNSYYYRKLKTKEIKDCKLRLLMKSIQIEKDTEALKKLQTILINKIKNYTEVIFATDANHSGIRSMDLFLVNVIGVENISKINSLKYCHIYYALSNEDSHSKKITIDLNQTYKEEFSIKKREENYLYFRNSYLKKDFISLYILNRLYKMIGKVDSGFKDGYLSLNMVLMLNESKKIKYFDEIIIRDNAIDKKIGSFASMHYIFEQLLENKYISTLNKSKTGFKSRLYVNDKGLNLLEKIEKEINLNDLLTLAKSYESEESYESFKEKVLKI